MSTVYDLARPEVHEMAKEILAAHHTRLFFRGKKSGEMEPPTLAILMASKSKEEDDDPPLKDGPYAVAGKIKPVAYIQRVDGRRDAEVLLDEGKWDNLTEPQQRALLDELITSLEVDTDKESAVKTDDWGRPKLRIRACDWHLEGFAEIAQRYGADAPCVIAAREFQKRHGAVVLEQDKQLAFAV